MLHQLYKYCFIQIVCFNLFAKTKNAFFIVFVLSLFVQLLILSLVWKNVLHADFFGQMKKTLTLVVQSLSVVSSMTESQLNSVALCLDGNSPRCWNRCMKYGSRSLSRRNRWNARFFANSYSSRSSLFNLRTASNWSGLSVAMVAALRVALCCSNATANLIPKVSSNEYWPTCNKLHFKLDSFFKPENKILTNKRTTFLL